LEQRIASIIGRHERGGATVEWSRSADIRYTTQVNEVAVPAANGTLSPVDTETLISGFESEYARLFGDATGYPDAGYLMTAVRTTARLSLGGFQVPDGSVDAGSSRAAPVAKAHRDVIFYERGVAPQSTPVYDGDALAVGDAVDGPAIVEFVDTTLVVRHGERASMDVRGSVSVIPLLD
jgi:N-methylhydantoinase A